MSHVLRVEEKPEEELASLLFHDRMSLSGGPTAHEAPFFWQRAAMETRDSWRKTAARVFAFLRSVGWKPPEPEPMPEALYCPACEEELRCSCGWPDDE